MQPSFKCQLWKFRVWTLVIKKKKRKENLSGPKFSHLQNGENSTCLRGLWGKLNWLMCKELKGVPDTEYELCKISLLLLLVSMKRPIHHQDLEIEIKNDYTSCGWITDHNVFILIFFFLLFSSAQSWG